MDLGRGEVGWGWGAVEVGGRCDGRPVALEDVCVVHSGVQNALEAKSRTGGMEARGENSGLK